MVEYELYQYSLPRDRFYGIADFRLEELILLMPESIRSPKTSQKPQLPHSRDSPFREPVQSTFCLRIMIFHCSKDIPMPL